jgi:hypothetical protein
LEFDVSDTRASVPLPRLRTRRDADALVFLAWRQTPARLRRESDRRGPAVREQIDVAVMERERIMRPCRLRGAGRGRDRPQRAREFGQRRSAAGRSRVRQCSRALQPTRRLCSAPASLSRYTLQIQYKPAGGGVRCPRRPGRVSFRGAPAPTRPRAYANATTGGSGQRPRTTTGAAALEVAFCYGLRRAPTPPTGACSRLPRWKGSARLPRHQHRTKLSPNPPSRLVCQDHGTAQELEHLVFWCGVIMRQIMTSNYPRHLDFVISAGVRKFCS